ncbi:unnamed protein product [Cochlearia groenlandica]
MYLISIISLFVVIISYIPASEDFDLAVEATKKALTRNKGENWSKAFAYVRAKYLRAIATKVTERKSELAKLEAIDSGKPLDETAWDVNDVAGCFEYYVDLVEGLDAKQKSLISLSLDTFKSYVRVTFSGNPWVSTCLELADICREVGLPPGVLNILTGLGTEAGAPLATHPHVGKVR